MIAASTALPANCSAFSWLVTPHPPLQETVEVDDLGSGAGHRRRSCGLGLHIGTEVDRHVELHIGVRQVRQRHEGRRVRGPGRVLPPGCGVCPGDWNPSSISASNEKTMMLGSG